MSKVRLSDFERAAKEWGITLVNTKKGRHPFKFVGQGHGNYPVPAHNGKRSDVGREYIRGFCHHFDIPQHQFEAVIAGADRASLPPEPPEPPPVQPPASEPPPPGDLAN